MKSKASPFKASKLSTNSTDPKFFCQRVKASSNNFFLKFCCKLDEINTLAKEYNIAHVEDCAQSFGATHNNKQSGTYGEFGCFSFFPTKNLGCFGDGGLITVKNKKAYNLLLKLRTHGGIKRNQHDVFGYNSRLDELQAAILTIKLPYINKFIENRRSIAKMYFKLINNDKVILPYVNKNSKHTFNQFTLRVKNRNKLSIVEK